MTPSTNQILSRLGYTTEPITRWGIGGKAISRDGICVFRGTAHDCSRWLQATWQWDDETETAYPREITPCPVHDGCGFIEGAECPACLEEAA